MAELKHLADLKGDVGPPGDVGAISPFIYIGPDEPDATVTMIWIDTRGLEDN